MRPRWRNEGRVGKSENKVALKEADNGLLDRMSRDSDDEGTDDLGEGDESEQTNAWANSALPVISFCDNRIQIQLKPKPIKDWLPTNRRLSVVKGFSWLVPCTDLRLSNQVANA